MGDDRHAKIRKQFERYAPFTSSFNKETDRGVAIVAPAMLHEQIGCIIKAGLRADETRRHSEATQRLMDGPTGLGAARARIDMGLLLNIYGEVTHCDLCTINGIRNEFAHNLTWKGETGDPISFATPSIVDRCRSLLFIKTLSDSELEFFKFDEDDLRSSARIIFVGTACIISNSLLGLEPSFRTNEQSKLP